MPAGLPVIVSHDMVVPHRLSPLLVWLLVVLLFSCRVSAQDPTPQPAPPTVLEKLGEQIAKQDDELRKKTTETRAVVEAEIAAKRIDANAAQSLLWALRANDATSFLDVRPVVSSTGKLPAPNEAINDAVQKLEALWKKIQNDRIALAKEAAKEALKRTLQLAQIVDKPAEIEPLRTTLESVQTIIQKPSPLTTSSQDSGIRLLSSCIDYLRNLRGVLVARDNGDPKLLGRALSHFRIAYDDEFPVPIAEMQRRTHQVLKPYADAIESAQTALEQLLVARSPTKELATGLAKLEDVVSRLQTVGIQAGSYLASSDYDYGKNSPGTYRELVGLARAIENQDIPYLRQHLANVRQSLPSLGAVRANTLDPLLADWQKQLDTASGRASATERSTWGARLAAAKKPDDLEALALELQRAERDAAGERDPEFPRGLGNQLATLAVAWSSANPALVVRGNFGNEYTASAGAYGKELNDLRRRIET